MDLRSRYGRPLARSFPELAAALAALPREFRPDREARSCDLAQLVVDAEPAPPSAPTCR